MNVLTENDLNEILICEICHTKYDLYDEPKIIPCGLTICGQCEHKIDEQMITRSFKCLSESCGEVHLKPVKGFPVNKIVIYLQSSLLKNIYRSEDIETLEFNLKKIQETLNEITFDVENSDFKVKEHCTELRRLVQLSTEEKIEQINKQNDLSIKEIDDYETECIQKIVKNEISKIKENKEIELFLEEKSNYLKTLNKINEQELKESIQKANDYKLRLERKKENLLSLNFNLKKIKFDKNDKKIDDDFIGKIYYEQMKYNKENLMRTSLTIKSLTGHTSYVMSLAILQESLVSGSIDKTIRIWNINSGETTKKLTGHNYSVSSLALLPDGLLASGSIDNTIKIWDVNSGSTIETLTGHKSDVLSLAVLQDGSLVSGSSDKTIRVWNVTSGSTIKILIGHNWSVSSLAVLKDGTLASGSIDNTIRIWDINKCLTIKILTGHTDGVYSLAILQDGSLISGSKDKTIRIWNVNSGLTIKTLSGHTNSVLSLAVLKDSLLASGSSDATIRIWNINTGLTVKILTGNNSYVNCLQVLQDGLLACGYDDKTIRIWNLN